MLAFVSPSRRNLSLLSTSSPTGMIPNAPRRHHGFSSATGASSAADESMLRPSPATRSRIAACCGEWAGNKPKVVAQRFRALTRSPDRVATSASAASCFSVWA